MLTPAGTAPRVEAFGDSALLVVVGDGIDASVSARVHAMAASLNALRDAGDGRWGVPVAGYSTLLVPYDPELTTHEEARGAVARLAGSVVLRPRVTPPDPEPVEIPVRYGGTDGPDLEDVAERVGLTPEQVVATHTGATYRVFLLGFVPGFAYLGPLPPALVTPRRATPRARVPAGSVAIAGEQTGVYPLDTPGGWNLLGRTHARLWDLERDPPALLRPGALVRFVRAG